MLHTYACKTLNPGFFWYAVYTNLFRLRSKNPWKKFPDPGYFLVGDEAWKKSNFFSSKVFNFFFKSVFFTSPIYFTNLYYTRKEKFFVKYGDVKLLSPEQIVKKVPNEMEKISIEFKRFSIQSTFFCRFCSIQSIFLVDFCTIQSTFLVDFHKSINRIILERYNEEVLSTFRNFNKFENKMEICRKFGLKKILGALLMISNGCDEIFFSRYTGS